MELIDAVVSGDKAWFWNLHCSTCSSFFLSFYIFVGRDFQYILYLGFPFDIQNGMCHRKPCSTPNCILIETVPFPLKINIWLRRSRKIGFQTLPKWTMLYKSTLMEKNNYTANPFFFICCFELTLQELLLFILCILAWTWDSLKIEMVHRKIKMGGGWKYTEMDKQTRPDC